MAALAVGLTGAAPPAGCSRTMGAGGNVYVDGLFLSGKCEGDGLSPVVTADGVVEFRVPPGWRGGKDRSELAFAGDRLPFGVPVTIDVELFVPAGSDVTDSWFYLLQLWQGTRADGPDGEARGRPPIAGLRMNRGASHRASFIVRDAGNEKGDRVATVDIGRDRWVPVTIALVVEPGGTSTADVWVDGRRESWRGSMGYTAEEGGLPWFRVKFGIYKDDEAGRDFRVRFKVPHVEVGLPG